MATNSSESGILPLHQTSFTRTRLTKSQAAVLQEASCKSCGASMAGACRLDTWRRSGWALLFLECVCGAPEALKYRPVRRAS